jgi:chromosome segregation ATPase
MPPPIPVGSRYSEEFNRLVERVLTLETRITVFETRAESWDRRLLELHMELNRLGEEIKDSQSSVRTSLDALHGLFRTHVQEESRDRNKMFLGILSILGTILGSIVVFFVSQVWGKLFP